jgi:hypothetical protein
MLKEPIKILFALRFYLVAAGLLWWLLPVQRSRTEFKIFHVTTTAIQFMNVEKDRILKAYRSAEKRNVAFTTLVNGRAGGRTPN